MEIDKLKRLANILALDPMDLTTLRLLLKEYERKGIRLSTLKTVDVEEFWNDSCEKFKKNDKNIKIVEILDYLNNNTKKYFLENGNIVFIWSDSFGENKKVIWEYEASWSLWKKNPYKSFEKAILSYNYRLLPHMPHSGGTSYDSLFNKTFNGRPLNLPIGSIPENILLDEYQKYIEISDSSKYTLEEYEDMFNCMVTKSKNENNPLTELNIFLTGNKNREFLLKLNKQFSRINILFTSSFSVKVKKTVKECIENLINSDSVKKYKTPVTLGYSFRSHISNEDKIKLQEALRDFDRLWK